MSERKISPGDKVITEFGTGVVRRIRTDSNCVPIFTVVLDDVTGTPDGLLIARDFELRKIC